MVMHFYALHFMFSFLHVPYSLVFLCFFSLSLSLSPFSFLLMAPKKSVTSKNLIRHHGSSSSSSSILDTVRFHDEKAKNNFFENFSNQAIHSEHQVILSDFPNTPLPNAFSPQGWASLCEIPKRCPGVFI